MEQDVLNLFIKYLAELTVVAVGYFAMKALNAFRQSQIKAGHTDTVKIIDNLTDRAVEFAQKEFESKSGQAKRALAVEMATKWLADRGIEVNESEIVAGIENGYNKLKAQQAEVQAVQSQIAISPEDGTMITADKIAYGSIVSDSIHASTLGEGGKITTGTIDASAIIDHGITSDKLADCSNGSCSFENEATTPQPEVTSEENSK